MPGSIAPLVMGWQRRMGGVAGPLGASGEASNGNPVQIEAFINGVWTDITSYVMVRDNSGNISITRGRRDEGSNTEQSSCQMTLNNRDGRWSPRNPTGPYYGHIGRNTPVRISVPDGLGGKSYRFQGEISVWPQSWDPTGTDVWTDVEGSGVIRRLSQAPPPADSVLFNAITGPTNDNLRAYWPMEDPDGSLSLASPLTSVSDMTYTGTPTLAGYSGFPASDPVPDTTSTIFTGNVPKYDDPTATQVRFFCFIPSDGLVNGTVVCQISQLDDGGAQLFDLYYGNFGATGHGFTLHAMQSDGTDLGVDLENTYDVRGKKMYISIELAESGTSTTRAVRIYDLSTGISYDATDTVASSHLNRVTRVRFGPASISAASPHGSTGLSAAAIGHVTVEDAITSITTYGVHLNPVGEVAGRRVQRVCAEAGIAFESIGDLDDTVAMGNQTKLNALDLMQEAEAADNGMLYEMMSTVGMGYRTRASLTNQDAQLTLNYAGFNLSEVPTPVEDDRYIQNQVTVTVNGISETYSLDTGTLSIEQPPTGVGVYGQDLTLNLESSADALNQAAWHVHLGTVDEPRYPTISVNLAHSTFTSNPALKQAVLGLKQGDRIVIQNPPSWLPPGDIDQLVLGFNETITNFEHRVTFTCSPASPYNNVDILDAPSARIDTPGSELVGNLTTTDTSAGVKPSAGYDTLWTKSASDLPLNITVSGETITVTNISDLVTDTFTRTVANSWGTNDSGYTYTNAGGTSADFAVNGTVGTHTLATAGASRRSYISTTLTDFDYYVSVTADQLPTGDILTGGLVNRFVDANNLYHAYVHFTPTTNAVGIAILKRVNAVETVLGTYTMPGETFVASTYYRIRFQLTGTQLRTKIWLATDAETPVWNITVYDNALVVPSFIGMRSISAPANTNVNPVISYDDFAVVSPQLFTMTRSVNGIVKTHSAGEDVRLEVPTIISL